MTERFCNTQHWNCNLSYFTYLPRQITACPSLMKALPKTLPPAYIGLDWYVLSPLHVKTEIHELENSAGNTLLIYSISTGGRAYELVQRSSVRACLPNASRHKNNIAYRRLSCKCCTQNVTTEFTPFSQMTTYVKLDFSTTSYHKLTSVFCP